MDEIAKDILNHQFIEPAEARRIHQLILKHPDFSPADIGMGSKRVHRPDIRRQHKLNASETEGELNELAQKFGKISEIASVAFDIWDPIVPTVLQYQRNEPGDFFRWHRDYSMQYPYQLAAILYFSDSEDGLEGGETEFKDDKTKTTISVKPQAGMAVIFDPRILHQGAPVIKGVKTSLVGMWMHKG